MASRRRQEGAGGEVVHTGEVPAMPAPAGPTRQDGDGSAALGVRPWDHSVAERIYWRRRWTRGRGISTRYKRASFRRIGWKLVCFVLVLRHKGLRSRSRLRALVHGGRDIVPVIGRREVAVITGSVGCKKEDVQVWSQSFLLHRVCQALNDRICLHVSGA